MKLARWTNHRIFNIRCIRAGITPKCLSIHSPIKGSKARTILDKAEKKLLELRVRDCSYNIKKFQGERDQIRKSLSDAIVDPVTRQRTFQHLERMRTAIFDSVKYKQQEKFDRLVTKKRDK